MYKGGNNMKVKEIEAKTGLTRHALRYYEKLGLIQDVARDKNGVREYSELDLKWILFLIKMKLTKMPLEDLKLYADSFYTEDPDVESRISVLKRHKEKMAKDLEEMQETMKYIDYKIDYYENFRKESDKPDKTG